MDTPMPPTILFGRTAGRYPLIYRTTADVSASITTLAAKLIVTRRMFSGALRFRLWGGPRPTRLRNLTPALTRFQGSIVHNTRLVCSISRQARSMAAIVGRRVRPSGQAAERYASAALAGRSDCGLLRSRSGFQDDRDDRPSAGRHGLRDGFKVAVNR